MPPLRMPHHATLCSSFLNCQSNFRLKVFLLFLTPTAVSFFVYSFFCFSHASFLPDFLNWLFTLPPLHMPPHATLCSSSRVPAVVFQQTCSSRRVPAVVFQQSCFSRRVPAVVFQQSCSSIRVPAVVCFQQSCSSIRVPAVVFQHSFSSSRVPAVVFQHFADVFQQSCSSIFSIRFPAVVFQQSCSSSRVPAVVFQHSFPAVVFQQSCFSIRFSICVPASVVFQLRICVPASVFAFVLQQFYLCCSICVRIGVAASVFALVLQHLCFSFCVPASVLHKQSIAVNDNLDHLRHLCYSHISNNLPLWH
jgi:hypothetical protein